MGQFKLRIPASKNTPEHWQVISTNLSGPPAIGQLKMRDYDGWLRHVEQGTVGDDLLKLRHRKNDGWHNVLYMSKAGAVAAETWWIYGGYGAKPNGVRWLGNPDALSTIQAFADPQVSPTYNDEFGTSHTVSPDPNAIWAMYGTNRPTGPYPYNGNYGRNNQPSPAWNDFHAYGRAWRKPSLTDSALVDNLEYYPYNTLLHEYKRSNIVVDVDYILKHTEVDKTTITGMAITFTGVAYGTIFDQTHAVEVTQSTGIEIFTGGDIPGHTVGGTPLYYTYLDEVTGLNTRDQPLNADGQPTELFWAADKTIAGYRKAPFLPFLIGGAAGLTGPATFQGMFYTTGTHRATFQPARWEAGYTNKDFLTFSDRTRLQGTPITTTIVLDAFDLTTYPQREYVLYTDAITPSIAELPPYNPSTGAEPPRQFLSSSVEFHTIMDTVTLKVLTAG